MSDDPDYSQLAEIYTGLAKEQAEVKPQKYFIPNLTGLAPEVAARVLAMNNGLPVVMVPKAEEPFTPEQRRAIREEVDRALHPGAIDPRVYLNVQITDPASGHRYRGTVYLIEPMEGN